MKDVSTKPHARGELTDRIAGLSPVKQALLELRLKKSRASAPAKQTIVRRSDRDSAPPLSFAQQRLWFLDKLEPNSALYNIPTALRLSGPLNVEALQKSLAVIVERHEALRTTFASVDGEPVQVINANPAMGLAMIDLSAWAKGDCELEVQRILKQEARRPFNLSSDLMLQSTLIRLSEEENVLLLVMHHIASDGWSMGVLFRELAALYGAFCNEKPSPLPELALQYADYAIWQRQWLQSDVLEKQLSYWKKQLNGISTLQLPTDRPRPAVQTHRGARQCFELSRELTQGLKALSQKEGVTLFMSLLAVFQTLLYRYTGQEDVMVGSPIANRNRAEIEGLIGFFVNTLVLRTNFTGNTTFKELLAQVKEMALAAYAHQDLPFEKLVEELKPERNLSHSPLFQVMFVWQNGSGTVPHFEGLSVSPVGVRGETAKFDLTLFIRDGADGLRGALQYSTDLFSSEAINRMVGHFEVLLENIITDPNQPISALPILTIAEKHQLLVEWNDTEKSYPRGKGLHQLFEEQVERSPDAVAVTFENRRLTYRDLNTRANQLAHYLQKLGVGRETLVAICMERSLEMVVGLLGILKAGGAYVPLDPEYPQERLAFMVEDAQPAVLVTQERLQEKFPHPHARIVCLDRDWEQIAKEKQENTKNKMTGDDMAYVIYTSGTTGQPKGVMISHYNISRLFRATEAWFHFSNNDVWTMFHSYAFDFSVWEMWGALLYGGRVVIVPFWISRSPEKFYELLCQEKVTVLNQTPSAFRQLIQADQSLSNQTEMALRLIIFGGEALDFQSLQPWLDRHGDQYPQLVNMYGITETTVHVTYRVVRSTDVKPGVGSLVGVPLPDLNLYVLDKHRQLVPIGIPGELYVGGAGVGRGYLNRPELTAECFIASPFNERKGDKLYKTGDLVRRLSNGDLEYLGRTDAQVKIRGFRIELGEIESALAEHPGVQEVTALARKDVPGEKRLVAYVVLSKQQVLTSTELRTFVKAKLPDYMVPSAFVIVDSLPLTPNGKIDRKALPIPDHNRPELEESYVAPRTRVEKLLAEIWADVLKIERVGVHDNFFDLGGHSLVALRLFAEIEKKFKKHLPLSILFQRATIQHLASVIIQPRSANGSSSLVAIQPHGSKPPFFCIHEVFGDVLCYMHLARHLGEDRPFYALQARGLNGEEEPFSDIKVMAAHYIEEIRTVQPRGPYALGGLCVGGLVAFEMAQQLRAKGEGVTLVALLDSSVNSKRGRIVSRGTLLRDFFRDFPSWLIGCLQLNRAQWSSLTKRKIATVKARLHDAFRSSAEGSHQDDTPSRTEEGNPLFPFSEQHGKVARAQIQAIRKYRPQIYPGRLTLFRARMQPLFSSHKPDKGWRRVAGGGLDIKVVPGNHLGMLQEPHVRVLGEQLRTFLDRALTEVNAA